MSKPSYLYLASQNPHTRDSHIHFDEGPHTYTIEDIPGITKETKFTSVTTWVHEHFDHFDAKKIIAGMMRNTKKWNDPVANYKYYGKTAEEIEKMWSKSGQEAAAQGTEMHYKIECFYNHVQDQEQKDAVAATDTATATATDTTPEMRYFSNFHRDLSHTLKPYRTEWTVFHEEARIAGSIDMVFQDIGTAATSTADTSQPIADCREGAEPPLVIYDWKRCREITKTNPNFRFSTHPILDHIPDSNFWHYALQLNIYKYILQTKYGKTVTDLYLIVLHPEAQDYKRVKLPNLQTEVEALFKERISHFAAGSSA
jgi:hypothetical protein